MSCTPDAARWNTLPHLDGTGMNTSAGPEESTRTGQRSFAIVPAAVTFVCLDLFFAVQVVLAYRDHFLTVSQMRERGISDGLPFMWHFGMWGDLFIVSPLAAYVTGRYWHRWRSRWMLLSLAVGLLVSCLLSWTYTLSVLPEAHVQNHQLTATGVWHLFYMAAALAVFVQFFFLTERVSRRCLGIVSMLLLANLLFGTHMVLGIGKTVVPLDWWSARPLKSAVGWTILATVALGFLLRIFGTSEAFKSGARALGNQFMY